MAKRLDGKKVATGILAALAIYYLGGLISGSFDDDLEIADGAAPPDTGTDAGIETPITPMPEVAAPPPPPDVAQPEPAAPPAPPPTQNLPATAPATTQPAPTPAPSLKASGSDEVTATWFKKLSPGAQAALASGVVGGASALLQGLAAKSAQEDAKEREDRAREDKIRRGSIPAFSVGGLSAFRTKGV